MRSFWEITKIIGIAGCMIGMWQGLKNGNFELALLSSWIGGHLLSQI